MPEYVERRAVSDSCYEIYEETVRAGKNLTAEEVKQVLLKFEKKIQSVPAADVAPVVHGRWDGEDDGYADGEIVLDVWYCSVCGYCIDDGTDDPYILPNYCPNCGARMDGDG